MKSKKLSSLTAFAVGGKAENYQLIESTSDLINFIKKQNSNCPIRVFGSGTNLLVSDQDLPGVTIQLRGGRIKRQGRSLIVEAGVNWDSLVAASVESGLFGIELLSGIPGTVGGGVAINISAYGQSLADSLDWVEVVDRQSASVERIDFNPRDWGYKRSPFGSGSLGIISRVSLTLNRTPQTDVAYQTLIDYMTSNNLNQSNLELRRLATIEVRRQAGSIHLPGQTKTCGSFFKNPIVDPNVVDKIIKADETKLSKSQIKLMNKIHNRQVNRISAAHVLLAAGFKRGQEFGKVRLHPDHVLKLENWREATAAEIWEVANFIQTTVFNKFQIKLQPEVSLWGEFD